MTFTEWKLRYGHYKAIAERIASMRMDRARKIWKDATGYTWDGCSVHNASISDIGSGWGAGPNGHATIKAARRAKRIADSAWDGSRLVEAWDSRVRQLGFDYTS